MKPTEEQKLELGKALQQISADYYKAAIEILCMMGDVEELNYLRTPIHMPGDTHYLLALLHVSGPVLNLKKLNDEGYMDAEMEMVKVTSKESENV